VVPQPPSGFGIECDFHGYGQPASTPGVAVPDATTPLPVAGPFVAGPDSSDVVNWFGHPADGLRDHLRGATVFLVCGGPSLNSMDLDLLEQRGIVVAAINQVAATHVRPRYFFCVDAPQKFHPAIWQDPDILKFCRRNTSRGTLSEASEEGDWTTSTRMARDCPSVWFYESAVGFKPATFLKQSPIAWGGAHGGVRTTRNSMLPTLRLLYWMGARRVVLIGADFRMERGRNSYAFDSPKSKQAAGTNNNTYRILDGWFHELRPVFEAAGFHVVNATPGSRMNAFDRVDYDAAVAEVVAGVPAVETVEGLYAR
jgi:hypothetical protein